MRAAVAAAAVLVFAPPPLVAQRVELRGYALNVVVGQTAGPFTSEQLSDLQRIRLMSTPRLGPLRLDIAYEHDVTVTSVDAAQPSVPLGNVPMDGTRWLGLQGTLADADHVAWRHGLDRLSVNAGIGERVEITVGRQPISWATTLLLTPADPFAPFDPADPFRQYRTGVDALRAQLFTGAFSSVEFVLRPVDTPVGKTVTALARGRGNWHGWDVSGWLGILHDHAAASLAGTRTVAGAAVRSEAVLRDEPDGAILRFVLGVDRRFGVLGRDAYVTLEYQHDGLGMSDPRELQRVVFSQPFRRGELQVLGEDVAVAQGTWQLHPLLATDVFVLGNLRDPSVLIGAAASYSASGEVTVRGGIYWGGGDESMGDGRPASEFGVVPIVGYLSLTGFF